MKFIALLSLESSFDLFAKIVSAGIKDSYFLLQIIALGTPFGRVTNILYMKNNQQALLELEDESAAKKTVNYYTFVTPTIG